MEEKYHIKSAGGPVLKVYEDHVVISGEGILGSLDRIANGERTILYSEISSIQYKACGWVEGFIDFMYPGVASLSNKQNRFTFGRPTIFGAKKLAKEMDEVRDYIQQRIKACHAEHSSGVISSADEILKYKQLLDAGAITQEEYEKKKSQLLGI